MTIQSSLHSVLIGKYYMKAFFLFIFMLYLTGTMGQHLTTSVGLERTVAGTESQFQMGYQNKKEWALGGFYQARIKTPPFETQNGVGGASWHGVYLNAPLARSKKINFYAQLRAGFTQEKFFVCVPSLETKIKVYKGIAVAVGSSFRHTYPAFLMKVHISLFNKASL